MPIVNTYLINISMYNVNESRLSRSMTPICVNRPEYVMKLLVGRIVFDTGFIDQIHCTILIRAAE